MMLTHKNKKKKRKQREKDKTTASAYTNISQNLIMPISPFGCKGFSRISVGNLRLAVPHTGMSAVPFSFSRNFGPQDVIAPIYEFAIASMSLRC